MTAIKLILRDLLFWLILFLAAGLITAGWLARPTGPGSEGNAPLAGKPVTVASPDDQAVSAVMNGLFPKVDSQLTLAEAFSRYPWFEGPAVWIGEGPSWSRTVRVSAPLNLPGIVRELGVGSDAARVFYAAEFGLSGDAKSFRPLSSAVEVRDQANKLIARVPDPEFILVRRVMRGVQPGVSLGKGVEKGAKER